MNMHDKVQNGLVQLLRYKGWYNEVIAEALLHPKYEQRSFVDVLGKGYDEDISDRAPYVDIYEIKTESELDIGALVRQLKRYESILKSNYKVNKLIAVIPSFTDEVKLLNDYGISCWVYAVTATTVGFSIFDVAGSVCRKSTQDF